jgi:hypothetical protein
VNGLDCETPAQLAAHKASRRDKREGSRARPRRGQGWAEGRSRLEG